MRCPARSVIVVRRIAVLRRYSCAIVTTFSISIAKRPSALSSSSRLQNTGSPSKRGTHSHDTEPYSSMSAPMRELPTTPARRPTGARSCAVSHPAGRSADAACAEYASARTPRAASVTACDAATGRSMSFIDSLFRRDDPRRPALAGDDALETAESEVARKHVAHGHLALARRVAALVVEGLEERVPVEARAEPVEHAPGEPHAAIGAEGEAQIAGEGAEQPREPARGRNRIGIAVGDQRRDARRGEQRVALRLPCVQHAQALAAQQPLPGNARPARACRLAQALERRVVPGESHVTGFAGEHPLEEAAGVEQRRGAESGARPDQQPSARRRRSATQHLVIVVAERRQPGRGRDEVVDQPQLVESELATQFLHVEGPRPIRHPQAAAAQMQRDRDRAAPRGLGPFALEGPDRVGERLELVGTPATHRRRSGIGAPACETRVGAADVGEDPGCVGLRGRCCAGTCDTFAAGAVRTGHRPELYVRRWPERTDDPRRAGSGGLRTLAYIRAIYVSDPETLAPFRHTAR